MGSARWYFVIDSFNDAHKISKGGAQLLLSSDYVIPEGIPHRDEHGVLHAEVVMITKDRRAERVERISLYSLPARESAVGERAVLCRGMTRETSAQPWSADDAVKHLEKALGAGAPRALVLVAAEAVAALGCTAAFALIQRIRKGE